MRNKLYCCIQDPCFWVFVVILAAGSFVRLAALDRWPLGLHQDEAFSAYNAWSLINFGVDSEGYVRPVYYTVWGSGMNILYSWLEMPFIAVLGTTVWAMRLPQALVGSVAIVAAYYLGKEFFDKRMGLAFAAMLAINPWHILQSRFGLESSLAAPMLLFGMVFLCRYLNGKRKSLVAATVFLGLTLYSYAITWPLVPTILVLTFLFFRKRIRFDKYLLGCIGLLFLIALPLILFIAVNFGWIPEIRTSILSIPKLTQIRAGEFDFSRLYRHLKWNLAMLWAQHDDRWWITSEKVGAYYYISVPFILFGMLLHVRTLWQALRNKQEIPLHFMLGIWFGAMFIIGLGIDSAMFYKLNCLHMPIIFYGVYGLSAMIKYLKKWRWLPKLCVGVYLACFGCFLYTEISYPVNYDTYGYLSVSHILPYKYEDALDYAEGLTDGEISINALNYANVLLHFHTPPDIFAETVVYDGDDLAFRNLVSFDRYHFGVYPSEETEDWVYVFPNYDKDIFLEAGYKVEEITECYSVGYREDI